MPDTHTIEWDFGDGQTASGSLTPSHAYADDGVYTATLTVTDDDGGSHINEVVVIVENVGPQLQSVAVTSSIDENQFATLTGDIVDTGIRDSFTLQVDWGDGSPIETFSYLSYPAGTTFFSETHQYLDDNPTGTPRDEFHVTATVTDDDGGYHTEEVVVVVNNVAPSFDAGPDETLLSASAGAFSRTGIPIVDPGTLDTFTGTVNFGDGTGDQPLDIDPVNRTFHLDHTFESSGEFTVAVTVQDDDLGSFTDTFSVFLNAPPVADAGGPYAVSEDTAVQLNAHLTSDPNQDPLTLLYQWDFDADGAFGEVGTAASRGGEVGVAPTFSALGLAPSSLWTVSLLVTDDLGETNLVSATVTVEAADPADLGNVVENVIAAGETEVELTVMKENIDDFLQAIATLPPNTGTPIEITIVPERGTIGRGRIINVPEGYILVVDGANGQTTFEGSSPALTVASGDVVFKNGILLTNSTDAPTILIEGGSLTLRDVLVEESDLYDRAAIEITGGTLDLGTEFDEGGNAIDVRGDGEAIRNTTGTNIAALGNTFQIDGMTITDPFIVEGEIYHALDLAGLGLVSFLEGNVEPRVAFDTVSTFVVAVGEAVTFGGSFQDIGSIQTHTAAWTIESSADATSVQLGGVVSESLSSGTVAGEYAFDAPGVYTITLAVADEAGGTGTATTLDGVEILVAVYDPSGGFVTGGGWIDSPEGAYTADPSLTGRASFGFVSKYKNGQSTPDGQTQFQFKAGDLNFHSTSYDWLVIAGAKAKFKGEGTINGQGNFGFMLTATDGQVNGGGGVDEFRIKIWDKDDGDAVVYDNQLGEGDDSYAGTALGGGSVVIHDNNGNHLRAAAGAGAAAGVPLTQQMLNEAVTASFAQWASAGVSTSRLGALAGVEFNLAALPGSTLGLASSSTNMVWLDVDAAGLGWSIGGSYGGYDLLSAVSHEIGHKLGLDHDVLGAALVSGEQHFADDAPQRGHGSQQSTRLAPLPPISLAGTDAVFERFGASRPLSNAISQSPKLHAPGKTRDEFRENRVKFASRIHVDLRPHRPVVNRNGTHAAKHPTEEFDRVFGALGEGVGKELSSSTL